MLLRFETEGMAGGMIKVFAFCVFVPKHFFFAMDVSVYTYHTCISPPPHMHTQTYAHVCVLMILNASASIPFACAYCQAKNCDDEMASSKLPKWKINTYYSTMRRLDTFCSYKKNIVLFPYITEYCTVIDVKLNFAWKISKVEFLNRLK